MANPLKILGDLKQMRQEAATIQAALEKEEFEVVVGKVRVIMTGNQNVKTIEINGVADEEVRRAVQEAIKKSQQAAAGKLAEISKRFRTNSSQID